MKATLSRVRTTGVLQISKRLVVRGQTGGGAANEREAVGVREASNPVMLDVLPRIAQRRSAQIFMISKLW